MHKIGQIIPCIAILALLSSGGTAQQEGPAASSAAELIARERLRSKVEQALATYAQPVESGEVEVDNFVRAAEQLVEAGPGVQPYIINELEQRLPNTFFLCAYALGLLNTAEGESALREAIALSDREKGDYPVYRKGWAVLALSMMGKADALDLLTGGEQKAGGVPVHSQWSALEAVALHTYPESLPRLTALLDLYFDNLDMRSQRVLVLEALWHLADPTTVPKLMEVMQEDDIAMRMAAARALGAIDSPEALAAAQAALADDDKLVRRAASWSLAQSAAKVDLKRIMSRLEVESDATTRGSLYDLAATHGGPAVVRPLMEQWGRGQGSDRANLLQAIGRIGSDEALPVIREGLYDRDGNVVLFATRALGMINSQGAVDLLIEAVRSRNALAALESVRVLRELRARRGAPAIADRLMEVELAGALKDAKFRSRAILLSEALIDLDYHQAADKLKRALERHTDSRLLSALGGAIARLEFIKSNGRKAKKWIAILASPDRESRLLAYRQLGEIGGADAARALTATFGRVDTDEGVEILRALGASGRPEAADLIERVLVAPEFDIVERAALRNIAAWCARRLGGERMTAALKEAAKRRHGRDIHVLINLALLEGEKALPLLADYRLLRMRYVGWMSGKELEKLDWISRHLSAGLPISALDLPPEKIQLN